MMTFHNLEQGSPEWLLFRRKKIGASDASTILGVNQWSTPYQLWLEKITGEGKKDNEFMKHGRDNEDPARELFQKMTGIVVSAAVATNNERDWQAVSFDGIDIDHENIVEIKCPKNHADHIQAKEGKIPDKYFPQVQHQLAVSGLNMAYYFSYQNGKGAIVEVKRDDAYLKELLKVEEKFYFEHLVTGEPPALTDKDYIERSDDMWDTLSYLYLQANRKIKALEEEEKAIRERLIQAAQNHNSRGNGVLATRIFVKGNVDYKAIPQLQSYIDCEAIPELKNVDLEQYRKKVDLEVYRKPTREQWRISVNA